MKAGIHPQYFNEVLVTCSCGNTFTSGSTKQDIHVEVCFKCHPLYTGEKRFVDTLGQVGKFQKKQEAAKIYIQAHPTSKKDKNKAKSGNNKSLKELLLEV